MFFRLFLLFTIIPVAELYLFIRIGEVIGALNTVLIILLTAVFGAYLAKNQGFLALNRIRQAIAEGRPPGKELLHGLFVLVGGVLLLTPGFLTDVLGLSMLLPLSREIYLRLAEKVIRRKIETGKWDFHIF